jgi:hypothetical protein
MDAATTEMSEGGAADAQEMAQSPEATEDGDARDGDEPETTLVRVRDNHAAQIRNPLTRFLHAQAHGRYLPIYGGLENRRQLLDEIVVKRKT